MTCVGLLIGNPTMVLLGLVVSATVAVSRRLPLDFALPLGTLALLSAAITAGVVAGALGVDLLARPRGIAVALAILAFGASAIALALPDRRDRSAFTSFNWLAASPAVATACLGVVQAFRPDLVRSWAFWGTDFAHHMTIVDVVRQSGNLDYAAGAYPKGLHFLAALVAAPGTPSDPLASLDYTMSLFGALTILTLALLLWTASSVALRLGNALGVPRFASVMAATAVGVGPLLTNTFVQTFVFFGAAQSFVAAIVLLLLGGTIVLLPRMPTLPMLVLACAAAAMLLAHLWQPLVVAPVLAVLALSPGGLRDLRGRLLNVFRARPRRAAMWALGIASLAVLAAVPLVTVQQQGGAGAAATPGDLPEGPWLSLVLALGAAATLSIRWQRPWVRMHLSVAGGLLAAVYVLVRGASNGWDLSQYYPLKSLWFVLMFLAPLLAVRTAGVLAGLWRVTSLLASRAGAASLTVRTTIGGLAVAIAFAVWLPWLLGPGSVAAQTWSIDNSRSIAGSAAPLSSSEVYALVRDYGARFPDEVLVPYQVGPSLAFDSINSKRVSGLLTFLTGQPEASGSGGSVCAQIVEQAGDQSAVVLTRLSPSVVRESMRKGGCSMAGRVVQVPAN